jgi:hypothetical protein
MACFLICHTVITALSSNYWNNTPSSITKLNEELKLNMWPYMVLPLGAILGGTAPFGN